MCMGVFCVKNAYGIVVIKLMCIILGEEINPLFILTNADWTHF